MELYIVGLNDVEECHVGSYCIIDRSACYSSVSAAYIYLIYEFAIYIIPSTRYLCPY